MCEYDDNEEKILLEALRHTETQLDHLNQIATAADNRAMAFTGFAGVMATLFISAASSAPLPAVGYLGALGILLGGTATVFSAAPRGFYVPGHRYRYWVDHLVDGDEFSKAIESQAKENDDRIDANEVSLGQRASQFRSGVQIVVFSALVTVLVQLIGLAMTD